MTFVKYHAARGGGIVVTGRNNFRGWPVDFLPDRPTSYAVPCYFCCLSIAAVPITKLLALGEGDS
jgi:hypothetical protein